ncbi:hypothetical protein PXJ20_32095 [Paraburkholderia sp. A1RI_3L]|uniref:hypothetical protein n=1 Tax=Paraburkholderia TaxID=1822464 RepID=UPI003B76A1A1
MIGYADYTCGVCGFVALRRQPQKASHGCLDARLISELLQRCREIAVAVSPHLLEEKRDLCNAVWGRIEFTAPVLAPMGPAGSADHA